MDTQTVALLTGGLVQIIVAVIAGWAAVASGRAERAANHGNKKIAELQQQLLDMHKLVARQRKR